MSTSSPITLHPSPSAGFDEPFEMLAACHERVQRMLQLMERLARHLHEQGADAQAQRAAQDVMRYFDIAGPAHHEDEERHLFPRLLAQGPAEVRAVVQGLADDHREMTAMWAGLRVDLQAVAGGRWPVDGGVGSTLKRWADFAALYRRHIAVEEAQAYPAARSLMDPLAQGEMGREMSARRGLR